MQHLKVLNETRSMEQSCLIMAGNLQPHTSFRGEHQPWSILHDWRRPMMWLSKTILELSVKSQKCKYSLLNCKPESNNQYTQVLSLASDWKRWWIKFVSAVQDHLFEPNPIIIPFICKLWCVLIWLLMISRTNVWMLHCDCCLNKMNLGTADIVCHPQWKSSQKWQHSATSLATTSYAIWNGQRLDPMSHKLLLLI